MPRGAREPPRASGVEPRCASGLQGPCRRALPAAVSAERAKARPGELRGGGRRPRWPPRTTPRGRLRCIARSPGPFSRPPPWRWASSTPGPPGPRLVWGDFDADGLSDVVKLAPQGPLQLYRNAGAGELVDVTETSGVRAYGVRSASWQDVDGDGRRRPALPASTAREQGAPDSRPGRARVRSKTRPAASGLCDAAPFARPPASLWVDFDAGRSTRTSRCFTERRRAPLAQRRRTAILRSHLALLVRNSAPLLRRFGVPTGRRRRLFRAAPTVR